MLRDEMPISELSEMGIELYTSTYDNRLYFDAVVGGEQVENFSHI